MSPSGNASVFGPIEVEAVSQLEVIGESLDDFDAEVRMVDAKVVLQVRPIGQRILGSSGEVRGHTGDPRRLVTVGFIDGSAGGIVYGRIAQGDPSTDAHEPFDDRDPTILMAGLLDRLVEPLAAELGRLEAEFS